MTLASVAFGFGQPLRPNLMFLVGVLALGPVLWWIRTLHIQIRRPRDQLVHVGFLSPPVFDRPRHERALYREANTLDHLASTTSNFACTPSV